MNRRELFRRAAGLAAAVGLTSKVGKAEAPRPAVTCETDAREAFGPRCFPRQARPLLYLQPALFASQETRAWLIEDHRQRAEVGVLNSGSPFDDCEKAIRLALERHGWPVDQESDLYCCATGFGEAVALKLRLRGFPVRQVKMPPIGTVFDVANAQADVFGPRDPDELFVRRSDRWEPLEDYVRGLRAAQPLIARKP